MSHPAHSTASGLPSGLWRNTAGAVLDLRIDGEKVSGTYQTPLGRANKATITGQTIGDLVSFSALWTDEKSMTSWTGRVIRHEGAIVLRTLWILARTYRDSAHTEMTEPWDSLTINSTDFTFQGAHD